MRIALISFNPTWLQPKLNLKKALDLLTSSFVRSCDLVVFPEMSLTGFSPQYGCLENSFIKECLSIFSEAAISNNYFIIFGALSRFGVDASDLPTNDAFVLNPSGKVICKYSKIHLFSPGDEHYFVRPGIKPSLFSLGNINCSLSICYDLRFPEIYCAFAQKVQLFINIASWPSHRTDHWLTLLKARAIESQSYMIGVNRTGSDGNSLLYDFSTAVYDPLGVDVSMIYSSDAEGCSYVDLDFTLVEKVRSNFGVLDDKKPHLYKSFSSSF